jgi:hypothetical protein
MPFFWGIFEFVCLLSFFPFDFLIFLRKSANFGAFSGQRPLHQKPTYSVQTSDLSALSKARKRRIGGDFGRLKVQPFCALSLIRFESTALRCVSKVFAFPFEKCVQ